MTQRKAEEYRKAELESLNMDRSSFNPGQSETARGAYDGPHADLTGRIIACAIEVHRALGPGLLESAYEHCLAHALIADGFKVERQIAVPISFRDTTLDCGYRIDLLVEDVVVIELKSVDETHPIHEAQLLTYLKLSGKRVGLLINFNVTVLTRGLKRLVI